MSFESVRFSKSYEDKTEEAYFFKQYDFYNPQSPNFIGRFLWNCYYKCSLKLFIYSIY